MYQLLSYLSYMLSLAFQRNRCKRRIFYLKSPFAIIMANNIKSELLVEWGLDERQKYPPRDDDV
jgi:hypothetical protein